MQASLERLRARREDLGGNEGGFTLIELLIVIVILAILAAIVVFAVQNLTSSSAQSSCRADFKTVESATEAYKSQMGAYPTGNGAMAADGTTVSTATHTDTASNAAPAFQTQAQLAAGAAGPLGVNAARAFTSAVGGILLTGSNTTAVAPFNDSAGNLTVNLDAPGGTPATKTGAVGPWLKDVPANTGHYTIWVANDGTGQVGVLNAQGIAVASAAGNWFNDANACANI